MRTVLGVTLYTAKEAADILHITERTARTYIKTGKLQAQKIGGKWAISEENLKAFLGGTKGA